MDWTMVAAVGELIGALAVVLSLVYVGKQVRHSNLVARSAVRRDLSSQTTEWAMSVASSPELTSSVARMTYHGAVREDFAEEERIQIAFFLVSLIGQVQMAHQAMLDGHLTADELLELYGSNTMLTLPYVTSAWPLLRPSFESDFAEWFERVFEVRSTPERDDATTLPGGAAT